MQRFSFLDPSIFDHKTIESILEDIEGLVEQKKRRVEKEYKDFEKKYKSEKNEEWYSWQEDRFADDMFIVSELDSNLLNGLAVTVNTIFERHVGFFVREISKVDSSIKFNSRHKYKMEELKVCLDKVKHPNRKQFTKKLLNNLRIYTDIRNCIVHEEGKVEQGGLVRPFVNKYKDLFNMKNESLWIISVKGKYIRQVLEDHKTFFRLLLYEKNGYILYY